MSNKLGNEFNQRMPELSDKIITKNKMSSMNQKSNLMMVVSGMIAIDCKGNVATIISNSSINLGRFTIAGGPNSEFYIRNNSIYKMREQMTIIGTAKHGKGNLKLINTTEDLSYEKFPLYKIEQYYCSNDYKWTKEDCFQAFAYIDIQANTVNIIKVGYFDGLFTQSVDATNWERNDAIANLETLFYSKTTNMLSNTINYLKKYLKK